ncbi:MAG: magnesium transporter [Planctomycetales bacterium]|nr:magnesium transporter [Planctomycetales bacterium]
MLAENSVAELRECCTALHPARTAEFMEGLTAEETWRVLQHADEATRVEIFHYFELPKQIEIVETQPQEEVAGLITKLASDDRVDLLNEVDHEIVERLLPLLPSEERRDILHLRSYPEGTAGAVMTTAFAKLAETLTIRQAFDELQHQAEGLETIYYVYIVDDQDTLRGLVSARQLVSHMGRPETKLKDVMETGLVTAEVDDDQEEVAQKVARYDLLAIPVVDMQRRMLGIITYDDVIDVVREEATEDAHRSAAVAPLEESYLTTSLITLWWKRGMWLSILFLAALMTAFSLSVYQKNLEQWAWLTIFIPMVISSGGNMGNQSATLVITGMTSGDIRVTDWLRVVRRECVMGMMLGSVLGLMGLIAGCVMSEEARQPSAMLVIPLTVMSVIVCGSLTGAMLPLLFKRMGLDPALMSNPFVAGVMDILGIFIYMNVAYLFLAGY